MQITQWTSSLAEVLQKLEREVGIFIDGLRHDNGQAVFYLNGDIESNSDRARASIIDQFTCWEYNETPSTSAGFVMVSQATFLQAKQVNDYKNAFESLHMAIRAQVMAFNSEAKEVKASEIMRRILTLIGHPLLDLNKADRHIPYLTDNVKKIRWFENISQTTTRKPIQTVLSELEKIAGNADNYVAELAWQEHAHLSSLGSQTTVAYQPKVAVRSIRYSAQLYATQSTRTFRGYGASPILIPYFDEPPETIFFEDVRKKGAGRPTSVTHKRVSELVPHYYYYKAKTQTVAKAIKPKKAKNPYSKTRIPGVFFTIRRPFRPVIVIPKPGGGSTELSLKKHNLSDIWPRAMAIYNSDLSHSELALERLKPSIEQYQDFIEWEKNKHKME